MSQLELLVRGSAILICGLLLAQIARHHRASLRHDILLASLVGLALISAFTFFDVRLELPWQLWGSGTEALPAVAPTFMESVAPSSSPELATLEPRAAGDKSLLPLLVGLWFLGVVTLLLRAALGQWLAGRRFLVGADRANYTSGVPGPRAPRVVVSSRAVQPMTLGVFRPTIVVPRDFEHWPPARRQAALAHEHAHVLRRDVVIDLFHQLVRALWWPHPLVWFCGYRLRTLRERACDELVVRQGFDSTEYANQLVAVARALQSPIPARGAALTMLKPHDLSERVQALLRPEPRRGGRILTALAAAFAALLAVAHSSLAQEPVGTTPKPPVSGSSQEQSPRTEILLEFDGERLRCNGKATELKVLAAQLKALAAAGGRFVTLVVPKTIELEALGPVLAAARKGGFAATQEPEEARSFRRLRLLPLRTTATLPVAPPRVGDPRVLHFAITKEGQVLYQGRVVGIAGVRPVVRRGMKKGERPVLIQCADEVKASLLVAVVDEAKKGGAMKVAITSTEHSAKLPATVTTPVDAARSLKTVAGDSDKEAVSVASLDVRPRALHQPAPIVPDKLKAKEPVTVVLHVVVNRQGHVSALKVHKSTDARFEKYALDAVKRWRFEPGKRRGQAVPFRLRIPIRFATITQPGAKPTEVFPGEATKAVLVGSIRGVVLDKDFGAPLPGVQVQIVETGQTVTTSKLGHYVLPKLAPGSYELVFTRKGFVRQVRTQVRVDQGRLVQVDVSMTAAPKRR